MKKTVTINSKYNVGDELFYYWNRNVYKVVIDAINVTVYTENKKFSSDVQYIGHVKTKNGYKIDFYESDIDKYSDRYCNVFTTEYKAWKIGAKEDYMNAIKNKRDNSKTIELFESKLNKK